MATLSRNFTVFPEPIFLTPQNPSKILKLSISRTRGFGPGGNIKILGTRIKAVKREESIVLDEKDKELETKLNASVNGNGNGNGRYAYINGSVGSYASGSSKVENGNGSLMKYANGNGNGNGSVAAKRMVSEKKKKTVEEIEQEDAWFKRKGNDQVEVSVAPGGRWNKFKTYSTVQRTLEIWGFVISFLFKAWLNNQKFSYRGVMTEQKKSQRRKVLAKWLKENILRLGPTFIKIGQQFSTRVDILAQEYVDQLSELQDQVPPFPYSQKKKSLLFRQKLLYQ